MALYPSRCNLLTATYQHTKQNNASHLAGTANHRNPANNDVAHRRGNLLQLCLSVEQTCNAFRWAQQATRIVNFA